MLTGIWLKKNREGATERDKVWSRVLEGKIPGAVEGFVAKGAFINKEQAAKKISLLKKAEKRKKQIQKGLNYLNEHGDIPNEQLKKVAGISPEAARIAKSNWNDLKALSGELDKENKALQAEKDKKMREPTDTDEAVAEKITGLANAVAYNRKETRLGKHIPTEDMKGEAQKALWEHILRRDPAELQKVFKR
jgi:hypothetical protein